MSAPMPLEEPGSAAAAVAASAADGVLYEDQVAPEHGILGMTLRELLIIAAWLVAFVVLFFPVVIGSGTSLWMQGLEWVLPIGVPTAATFLIVLRRFSPQGIRRVGSLGIDQFASVAFSVAAVYWVQFAWQAVSFSISSGRFFAAWVPWAALAATLALVVLTVAAPLIPGLREDFRGRLETLAHRNANPVRPVIARPRAPRPQSTPVAPAGDAAPGYPTGEVGPLPTGYETGEVAPLPTGAAPAFSGQVPLTAHASGGALGADPAAEQDDYVPGYARRSRRSDAGTDAGSDVAPVAAQPSSDLSFLIPQDDHVAPVEDVTPVEDAEDAGDAEDAAPASQDTPAPASAAQPFWALAPTERDVVDETGAPIFRIGPTAWALVIEDRGGAFVIRHDDGRIGYLHDIADITRG